MRDDNDFFDDLIDDDTETFASEFSDADDDFDEDDEDADPYKVRSAVLVKNGLLALLTMKTNESGGQIVRVDPRETLPTAQRYDDAESAVKWFNQSLATSGRNGWAIIYDGEPLFG